MTIVLFVIVFVILLLLGIIMLVTKILQLLIMYCTSECYGSRQFPLA